MRLRQIGIGFNSAQRRLLRAFPCAGRRWLDIPIEQCVAISQFRISDRKLRIELDCAFQSLNSLAYAFGCSSRGVITSSGVELPSFFVLTRLRIRSWNLDLCRDGCDVYSALFLLLLRSRGSSHPGHLPIQRRMSQIAQNSFEAWIATQRIKLRLNTHPNNPCVSDRVSVLKQFECTLAFAEL